METLLIKFFKNFMTTIIIYYSRKLVFYIDFLLQSSFDDSTVVCHRCGEEFRIKIIEQLSLDNCLSCGEPFKDSYEKNVQDVEVINDRND